MTNTPAWIAQAKANDAQVDEAWRTALEGCERLQQRYNQLLAERTRIEGEAFRATFGTPRIALNEQLVIVAQRILATDREYASLFADAEALRRERMGLRQS
jgi:hypothetical protein